MIRAVVQYAVTLHCKLLVKLGARHRFIEDKVFAKVETFSCRKTFSRFIKRLQFGSPFDPGCVPESFLIFSFCVSVWCCTWQQAADGNLDFETMTENSSNAAGKSCLQWLQMAVAKKSSVFQTFADYSRSKHKVGVEKSSKTDACTEIFVYLLFLSSLTMKIK